MATTLLQISKVATNREPLYNDTLYVRDVNAYAKGGRSYDNLDVRRQTLKGGVLANAVILQYIEGKGINYYSYICETP